MKDANLYKCRFAIARNQGKKAEIILCDICLPDIDGYAVARVLRDNSEFSGVFLVAVTGYGQDADRELAREAGFDRHITKPISIESLRDVIQQASSGARQTFRTDV